MHAEGRLENNNIMCAYHAWSFNSRGNLVDVPQAHHSGILTAMHAHGGQPKRLRGNIPSHGEHLHVSHFLRLAFWFFGSYHHLSSPFKVLKIHS